MSKVLDVVPPANVRADLKRAVENYASTLNTEYLESRGIPVPAGQRWKLGTIVNPEASHRNYTGRLAIPYWTPAGYSAMAFRCTEPHDCSSLNNHSKYLSTVGYRPLFNVRALSAGYDHVYVCEGELNAIVATYCGYPCVATGGSSKWEPWWGYCFDGVSRVTYLADGDEAGVKAAKRLRTEIRHSSVIQFPGGEDVLSWYAKHGEAGLKELIGNV